MALPCPYRTAKGEPCRNPRIDEFGCRTHSPNTAQEARNAAIKGGQKRMGVGGPSQAATALAALVDAIETSEDLNRAYLRLSSGILTGEIDKGTGREALAALKAAASLGCLPMARKEDPFKRLVDMLPNSVEELDARFEMQLLGEHDE